jgi:redox-sensitive bicupin YhaK (pirin superfamily)
MVTQVAVAERDIVLAEDAHVRPMMGLDILEPLPSRQIPYPLVDPFILVHEGVVPNSHERAGLDTTHPHRGFDNLWYAVSGSSSTGHSTGPGGAIERARLDAGSLLKIRTGRGVYHAEGIGEEQLREGLAGSEMRGVLFWVKPGAQGQARRTDRATPATAGCPRPA